MISSQHLSVEEALQAIQLKGPGTYEISVPFSVGCRAPLVRMINARPETFDVWFSLDMDPPRCTMKENFIVIDGAAGGLELLMKQIVDFDREAKGAKYGFVAMGTEMVQTTPVRIGAWGPALRSTNVLTKLAGATGIFVRRRRSDEPVVELRSF